VKWINIFFKNLDLIEYKLFDWSGLIYMYIHISELEDLLRNNDLLYFAETKTDKLPDDINFSYYQWTENRKKVVRVKSSGIVHIYISSFMAVRICK